MPTAKEVKELHVAAFNEVMKEQLVPMIGAETALQVKQIVEKLDLQRKATGHDMTGLTKKMKTDFVDIVKATVFKDFSIDTKANEALIEEQDNRGGYLVSREIADAIMRIAASVGTILSQAAKWDMKTDELGVPNYTGSFLKGAYLGVDVSGAVSGLTFGQAQLIAKKWQLAFVVGNDLLADASVNVADWLLALGGEALANMIDYQGFVGGANTGDPFLGILNYPSTVGAPGRL
jgi:HK97 family phage major capsid protein